MPVYLCKPGWSSPEPWRHGVQVYAYPFRIDDDAPLHHRSGDPTAAPGSSGGAHGGDAPSAGASAAGAPGGGGSTRGRTMEFQRRNRGEAPLAVAGMAAGNVASAAAFQRPRPGTAREASDGDRASAGRPVVDGGEERDGDLRASPSQSPDRGSPHRNSGSGRRSSPRRRQERRPQPSSSAPASSYGLNPADADAASAGVGVAVRRIRHAEVVLVDEVSAAHGRYWLRLRWPGSRGGVAGYIALGPVRPDDVLASKIPSSAKPGEEGKPVVIARGAEVVAAAATAAGEGGAGRQFALRTQASEVSDNPATPNSSGHEGALLRGGSDDSAGVVVRRQTAQNEVASSGGALLSAAAAAAAAEATHLTRAPKPAEVDVGGGGYDPADDSALSSRRSSSAEEPIVPEDSEDEEDDDAVGTGEEEDEVGLRASDPSPPPIPRCASTGLYYPSSSAMELLAAYDDGLMSISSGEPGGLDVEHRLHGGGDEKHGEPVFCRICREGLHDVNYDLDSAGGAGDEGGGSDSSRRQAQQPPPPPAPPVALGAAGAAAGGIVVAPNQGAAAQALQASQVQGQGHPGLALAASAVRTAAASAVITHHPYAENPLLAPCECSGSMAFVHYLCVEQWRCRSRHPAARDGLNCETCGGLYALPPPPSRPASRPAHGGGGDPNRGGGAGVFAEDDWLDAMPPHVLAALRRPHLGWQIGAAVVHRRWLRPVAPVIASPLVALYCRARRSLKKRGVSRRRWACSLCRRRARWKCVRCLRSYYCSRQCQNVSWHIVHKHVCYKPVRFWWSVAVYGVVGVATFPGVLTDPAVYDLGASCLLVSFHAMGVLGGGMATALKKGAGVDVRGRSLELAVVAMTLWLTAASWGCVWGYFGDTSRCGWGTMGLSSWLTGESAVNWGDVADAAKTVDVAPEVVGFKDDLVRAAQAEEAVNVAVTTVSLALSPVLRTWRGFFSVSKKALVAYDSLWTTYVPSPIDGWICSGIEEGDLCLRMVRNANPDFFAPELGGEGKCASDLLVVSAVWMLALLTVLAGWVFRRRAERRAAAAAQQRRRPGPAVAVGAGPGGWARIFGRVGAPARVPRNRPRPHQD